MSNVEGCDPWDPRCSALPKPELFTAITPWGMLDTYQTYEEALNWLGEMDSHKNPVGVIHKHLTQIVYFNKMKDNEDGDSSR